MGSVRISDLCEFLRNDNNSFVDEILFHANVRGHLGIQNPVNREIATTLRHSDKDSFFFLNNGITIVCDKYLYQSGGFPVTLHRPQIVNGRQTAETIFSVFRAGDSEIGNVTVFVRVIETSTPSLIEEISVATNSQSRIGARDLRANHPIARKLGAGLHRLGYYYVRKRGEISTLPPEKTIDALKAGQLICVAPNHFISGYWNSETSGAAIPGFYSLLSARDVLLMFFRLPTAPINCLSCARHLGQRLGGQRVLLAPLKSCTCHIVVCRPLPQRRSLRILGKARREISG
jgi:AIPR protein